MIFYTFLCENFVAQKKESQERKFPVSQILTGNWVFGTLTMSSSPFCLGKRGKFVKLHGCFCR